MADEDLNIRVVTTADTTGIRQTATELEQLKEKARQDVGAAALFAKIPPDGAPPPKPTTPPKEPGEDIAGHIGRGLERTAIHAVGIGAIYEFLEAIKKSAEQINKITESLEKQGEALVKNAQLMAEATKFAQDQADVVKIGESGLKGVAEQHKNVVELQKQELSYWQQLLDSIAKGGQLGAGPLQQALDDALASAQALEEQARKNTAFDELTAQLVIAKRVSQDFDENIQEITKHIEEEEAKQRAFGPDNIEDYVKAGKAAEGYRKQLAEVIKLEEQRIKAANAAAAPLAKALVTPTGKFVEDQQKAEYQHEAQRAALEQKRREAQATGDTERQKAIEDELGHDTFARDQRKEALQRYVANQESLFRQPGETGADITRDLGTLGAKKLEAAQAELDQIYKQQRGEKPKDSGDVETHRLLEKLAQLWQ